MIHRLRDTEFASTWAPGICECGEVSKHVLPSLAGRQRWHRAHKLDARMAEVLDS